MLIHEIIVLLNACEEEDLSNMMDNWFTDDVKQLLSAQDIAFEGVSSYGGEDQGSDYWNVVKFTKDNEECFVKFHGWYASHYGTEYRGFNLVSPVEKTIIVYE